MEAKEKVVVRPNLRLAVNHHVGVQPIARPQRDVPADDTVRADRAAIANRGVRWILQLGWMSGMGGVSVFSFRFKPDTR